MSAIPSAPPAAPPATAATFVLCPLGLDEVAEGRFEVAVVGMPVLESVVLEAVVVGIPLARYWFKRFELPSLAAVKLDPEQARPSLHGLYPSLQHPMKVSGSVNKVRNELELARCLTIKETP